MKFYSLLFFAAIFFTIISCNSGSKTILNEGDDSIPFGLMIDFLRDSNKVIIIDNSPEFSWVVPKKAQKQTAFQILVSSSQENIWDSGKIDKSTSSNVVYSGKPLNPNVAYFWKVKVWGNNNWESEFSTPQQFKYRHHEGTEITSQNIFQIDSIAPKAITKTEEGSYFIDFGKDAFATLLLNYKTPQNDTLKIHLGEELINGKINQNPGGHIRHQYIELPVTPNKTEYLLDISPNERNTLPKAVALPASFPVLIPFRYVEINGMGSMPKNNEITQLAYYSYFEDGASNFVSNDSILNQVWDFCKYSIKATSFAGLYVDGDRERIPYEADAYLNQLSHYTTDREYTNARLTIEYFMQHPTWPTEWQLHVALMFYQDFMYTGNTELLEEYYEPLKVKTLMELTREDGLISSVSINNTPEFMTRLGFQDTNDRLRDIVDWPPAQKDTGWKLATAEGERDGYVFKPINTVVNCFFYENMKVMSKMATALGKKEDALEFNRKAKKAKEAINDKLFDAEKGIYVDGEGTDHASLHANMMALAFELVPEEQISSVLKFIKSRGMACSVYGSQYLLDGLYNAGEAKYALELMTATHDRSWYNMIKIGATVSMEAWDMKYKPNSDWNHAWGAVPANIIPRKMWGIEPIEPGGAVMKIKPQLANLSQSEIKVPTLKGYIEASFKKSEVQEYTFTIPANSIAELELNLNVSDKIKYNGEILDDTPKKIMLNPGSHIIKIIPDK